MRFVRFQIRHLLYGQFFVGLVILLWWTLSVAGCERFNHLPQTSQHEPCTYDAWNIRDWPRYLKHRAAVWRDSTVDPVR